MLWYNVGVQAALMGWHVLLKCANVTIFGGCCLGRQAVGQQLSSGTVLTSVLCFQPPGCPDYAMLSFMGGFHGRTFGKNCPALPCASSLPTCCRLQSGCSETSSGSRADAGLWALTETILEWQWDLISNLSNMKIPSFLNPGFPTCTSSLAPGVKLPQHKMWWHSWVTFYIGSVPATNSWTARAVIQSSMAGFLPLGGTHLPSTAVQWQRSSCPLWTVHIEWSLRG